MKQLIAKVAILSMLFFMSVPSLYAQSDAKGKDVPAKSSTEMKDVSLQQPKGKPITAAERQQENRQTRPTMKMFQPRPFPLLPNREIKKWKSN